MRVEPLGDAAYLLRDLERPAFEVAAGLNRANIPGLFEAVASYETVGLYIDRNQFDLATIDSLPFDPQISAPGKRHRIPVCYEMGEDAEEAANRLGISIARLAELHCGTAFRCFAVGFCPGFAYLGYLPAPLEGLPRKATPRVRVEPGSVAITGRQTAVYPLVRPGGWWLIGRTPLTLVDVDNGYFPIQAGDEVSFYPIAGSEYESRKGERL